MKFMTFSPSPYPDQFYRSFQPLLQACQRHLCWRHDLYANRVWEQILRIVRLVRLPWIIEKTLLLIQCTCNYFLFCEHFLWLKAHWLYKVPDEVLRTLKGMQRNDAQQFLSKVVEHFESYGCHHVGNECFEVIFAMYAIYLHVPTYHRIFSMPHGIKMVSLSIIFIKYCLEIPELKTLTSIKRFAARFSWARWTMQVPGRVYLILN